MQAALISIKTLIFAAFLTNAEGSTGDPAFFVRKRVIIINFIALREPSQVLQSVIHPYRCVQLDFLAQEFFREANTVGSKCSDSVVAHLVVDLKTQVERLREQVQNVE